MNGQLEAYAGINYAGRTQANRDTHTGFRFGVIPCSAVPYWHETAEVIYPDIVCCKNCECEFTEAEAEKTYWNCPNCLEEDKEEHELESPDCLESEGAMVKNEQYLAHSDCDSVDIFVEKSPFFTFAQFCSPCAPGACYLTNPVSPEHTNNICFCLGVELFDEQDGHRTAEHNGKVYTYQTEFACPYPVWEVATGKLVYVPASFKPGFAKRWKLIAKDHGCFYPSGAEG